MRQIENHTHTLYLIAPGGSPEAARNAMEVASALLRAGGLAVKVETSGRAQSAPNWLALTAHPEHDALYEAFVVAVGSDNGQTFYTCGMHNLGMPDALITGNLSADDAVPLMYNFLLYTFQTNREIDTGHTFDLGSKSFIYQVTKAPCTEFPEGHEFHNPYGIWRIEILPDKRH